MCVCLWQVHLSTHDSINKNTAKASLQQMLSVVFVRMEAKDTQLKEVGDFFYAANHSVQHMRRGCRVPVISAAFYTRVY